MPGFAKSIRPSLRTEAFAPSRTATCQRDSAAPNEKHKASVPIGTEACLSWRNSDRVDLVGLGTLWSLGGLELHPLALVERPESGRLDCAVVDENVRTAAVHGDEAVALFALNHLTVPCAMKHLS